LKLTPFLRLRLKFGIPPKGNANFSGVQHYIHHLSHSGIAGLVLANGFISSNTFGEGEILKNIIEKDPVDYMIALQGQLFYNTAIRACLWFLARNTENSGFRGPARRSSLHRCPEYGNFSDLTSRELTDE
jgi:type I restriction enzyme M protein